MCSKVDVYVSCPYHAILFLFFFSLQLCVYCPYIITTIPKSTYTYVNQLTLSCRIDAIVYTLQFDVAFIMEQKGEMCIIKRESDILMNTNITQDTCVIKICRYLARKKNNKQPS